MASPNDLIELSRQLKQERLFITSERHQLHHLNEDVQRNADQLFRLAWIARQQRQTLDSLILGSRKVTPEICFQQNESVESVQFIEGYKRLNYHEMKIGEMLKFLRGNPRLVSQILLEAEKCGNDVLHSITDIVVSGIYGNSIMSDDETFLLHVLKYLIELQVALNDNPRRLLRRGSCAFSLIFKLLNDGLFAAKLFLTAALHKPVMQLLMDVEWFYDIDPARALSRFPASERLRRFGQPGTKEYANKTKHYRHLMVDKLVKLTQYFLTSIRNNMYCFPHSLAWIISSLYQTVTNAHRIEPSEVRAICADLVMTFFICPAICDPEPFGITSDAPISYIARHNLMQVAQILQVLALDTDPGDLDPNTRDLYTKFDRGCMLFLLDLILDSPSSSQPPLPCAQLDGCARTTMLLTCSELDQLLTVARKLTPQDADDEESKQLDELLSQIPPQLLSQQLCIQTPAVSNTPTSTPPGTPSSIKKLKNLRDKKKLFLTPEKDSSEKGAQDSSVNCPQVTPPEEVLVISLGISHECPGFLSENKIIEQEVKPRSFNSLIPGEDDPIPESDIPLHEKRTRFSLSHDQDSIATSDNLEAISEAASSHSVGSDIDNENDNLSDMVSANVSGRGTPSISGRDTPLSLVESHAEQEEPEPGAPNLPVTVQKSNREDVTERFGKFEIKQELERYETKSTVSDTWSTDVLASDSEPPEQNQYERLSEVAEEMARQNLLGVVEVSEMSETTSDAWSVDVLASDTSERQMDRLLELDQDDMCSISSRSQIPDDVSEMGDPAVDQGEDNAPVSEAISRGNDLEKSTDTLPGAPRQDFNVIPRSSESQLPPEFMPSSGYKNRSDRSDVPFRHFDNASRRTDDYAHHSTNPFYNGRENSYSRRTGADGLVDSFSELSVSGTSSYLGLHSSGTEGFPRNYSDSMVGQNMGRGDNRFSAFTKPVKSQKTSGTGSMELIPNEQHETLKFTEQQHSKIDASCLSAVINIFDPLAQDDEHSDESTPAKSYEQLGTRPKTSHHDYGAMPKIAFVAPSLDEDSQSSGDHFDNYATLNQRGVKHDKKYSTLEADIVPLVSGDRYEFGDAGKVSDSGASSGHSSDFSMNGLLIDVPLFAAARNISEPSQNLQEAKDLADKKQQQDGKKRASLLYIFKEKWNKAGSFPVPVSIRGGKRKVNKEKEEIDPNSSRCHGKQTGVISDDSSIHCNRSTVDYGDPFSSANETSDEILDKYRRSSPLKPTSDSVFSSPASSTNQSKDKGVSWDAEDDTSASLDSTDSRKLIADAKKKLRLVLSTSDFQVMPSLSGCYGSNNPFRSHNNKKDNDLVRFLKVQLAEAINLQDKDLIAQLHETVRCLTPFDNSETKKLLKSMKEEYRVRSPYISYLVRCRQGLLSTLAYLERLRDRVQRNKAVSNKYFISVLVRLFIEKRERQFNKFISEFQLSNVSDEKTDLVERFLDSLNRHMMDDKVWKAANPDQISEARLCIEWNVMSRIYVDAMYPNGDGDICRDMILHENVQKLSHVITPGHREIRIPRCYHYECPWPAAQAEIYMINAYKTPRDKVQCVMRCSTTIMNLLSMANEKSIPAADDFMPVLIYVLIKANPQSLLSTVQYVNSFYAKRMTGEEQYWWIQFCSGIEFIKTMIMGFEDGTSSA